MGAEVLLLLQREQLRAMQQKPKIPRVRNWNIVEDASS